MGRLPKPLELHRLTGTFRKNRHEGKGFGEPLTVVPEPPKHLSASARRLWRELAPELVKVSALTSLDLDRLADYCTVRATVLECEAVIALEGRTIATPQGRKRHPEMVTLEHARAELRALSGLLGLSPSDRARLKLPPAPTDSDDEAVRFLFDRPKPKVG